MLDKGNIGQVIIWTDDDDDDQCQHDNINDLSHTTQPGPCCCLSLPHTLQCMVIYK